MVLLRPLYGFMKAPRTPRKQEAYLPRSMTGEATKGQAQRRTLVIIQGDNHQAYQFTTQFDPH